MHISNWLGFLHAGKVSSTRGLTEKQSLQEADRGGETAGKRCIADQAASL